MRKILSFITTFVLVVTVSIISFGTAQALEVNNVRVGQQQDNVRLVLDLDQFQKFRAFTLVEPNRLVIDLPSFQWNVGNINRPAYSGILDVRQGQLNSSVSRIVIDLKQPALVKSAYLLGVNKEYNKPNRLVVDFALTSRSEFDTAERRVFGKLLPDQDIAAGTAPKQPALQKTVTNITAKPAAVPSARKPAVQSQTKPKPVQNASAGIVAPDRKPTREAPPIHKKRKPVVIIDPGHGGIDPGAIGSNGVFEKHIVLAIAKDLQRELKSTGRYDVRMTRTTDKFLKLHERVAFARNNGGDLFISIHADSLPKSNARGVSVYTLSEKASDEQTAKLAQRENDADKIAGVDLTHEDDQVADILVDLVRRDTQNQSNFFANTLVDTVRSSNLKLLQNPHRYAGFAVLKAPDIPSVLVEAGFLSNSTEARLLSQKEHRRKVALALKAGVDAYFKKVAYNDKI